MTLIGNSYDDPLLLSGEPALYSCTRNGLNAAIFKVSNCSLSLHQELSTIFGSIHHERLSFFHQSRACIFKYIWFHLTECDVFSNTEGAIFKLVISGSNKWDNWSKITLQTGSGISVRTLYRFQSLSIKACYIPTKIAKPIHGLCVKTRHPHHIPI